MKPAIIIDLDSTLCNIDHRKKYIDGSLGKKDWVKFYENMKDDHSNYWCRFLLDSLNKLNDSRRPVFLFVTGRPEKYRPITNNWLTDREYCTGNLFMRRDGDFRHDYIIKKEVYENEIKDRYDVLFCLEDRKQVVDMWRSLGLICLHCDEGDF